ncbi:hypothetical protein [Streptomyces sp. bgisy100]|uniref:hypothetical protein n=1 Tax=Streptomyces sp. bgisy100 TaxID=3413783 RepID=UPI003D71011C
MAILQVAVCSVQVCTVVLPGAVARNAALNRCSVRVTRACWVAASAGTFIAVAVAASGAL